MNQSDFDQFYKVLSACLSMWDKAPSAEVAAVWFRSLEEYSFQSVSSGFSGHMRDPANGKFEPKPAHIIEQIHRAAKSDGRPGPEEAWAISLAARDEADTVVWTTDCIHAWFAAKPVMDMGDEVGARMAFRETYARLIADARGRSEPVCWEVSEGFDKERCRIAVSSAVEAGRIPAGRHLAMGHGESLLLGTSVQSSAIPANVREEMAALRDRLTARNEESSESDADRERVAALKQAQQSKVDQYMKGAK